jgi:hypothetical protein
MGVTYIPEACGDVESWCPRGRLIFPIVLRCGTQIDRRIDYSSRRLDLVSRPGRINARTLDAPTKVRAFSRIVGSVKLNATVKLGKSELR